jgi:hypothetical protein
MKSELQAHCRNLFSLLLVAGIVMIVLATMGNRPLFMLHVDAVLTKEETMDGKSIGVVQRSFDASSRGFFWMMCGAGVVVASVSVIGLRATRQGGRSTPSND